MMLRHTLRQRRRWFLTVETKGRRNARYRLGDWRQIYILFKMKAETKGQSRVSQPSYGSCSLQRLWHCPTCDNTRCKERWKGKEYILSSPQNFGKILMLVIVMAVTRSWSNVYMVMRNLCHVRCSIILWLPLQIVNERPQCIWKVLKCSQRCVPRCQ